MVEDGGALTRGSGVDMMEDGGTLTRGSDVDMVKDGGELTREMRVHNKTGYNTLTAVRKQVGTV